MSILIKNMKMPHNCDKCPLNATCIYTLHMPLYHTEKRHDNCTLIEVTDNHGRLIDEQEINLRFDNGIKTISKLPFPNDFVELHKQLVTEVKEEIRKCHTIIPASKEKLA